MGVDGGRGQVGGSDGGRPDHSPHPGASPRRIYEPTQGRGAVGGWGGPDGRSEGGIGRGGEGEPGS